MTRRHSEIESWDLALTSLFVAYARLLRFSTDTDRLLNCLEDLTSPVIMGRSCAGGVMESRVQGRKIRASYGRSSGRKKLSFFFRESYMEDDQVQRTMDLSEVRRDSTEFDIVRCVCMTRSPGVF